MARLPHQLTASEGVRLAADGKLSAESWAAACLARIASRDAGVRAWSATDRDGTLADARARDSASRRGPLHGVPIGVKDVILTRDFPTQYNSPIYEGFHPQIDAAVILTLRAAGATILGKTETVEFAAAERLAPTRNPHNAQRTPGGSSSGSAAAVADCHCPIALGTQTGGSMIRPASYCGVYALKPSWGLVSMEGVKAYSPSLDTLGWFARSIDDLALILDILTGDARSPLPLIRPQDLRIAVCRTPGWSEAAPETRAALERAVATLKKEGASVTPFDAPEGFDNLTRLQRVIMRSEGRASFRGEYAASYNRLNPRFREMVENVDRYTTDDLLRAQDAAAACRAAFDARARGFHAILAPSAPGEAPIGLGSNGSAVFNSLWTLLHAPCANIPVEAGPHKMPVGLSIVGARQADRATLAAAKAVVAALTPSLTRTQDSPS